MLENFLDNATQQSAFRHIHPGTKLILCLGSLIICLISPSPVVPLISGIVLSIVLIVPARVSPVLYGELLGGPAIFTLISVVVLLFLVGGGDILWRFNPAPWLNLTITEGSLREGILVLYRVFGCSVSLFFLTLATPMTDQFNGIKRAGIPVELIDLMMIIYRYIFIVSIRPPRSGMPRLCGWATAVRLKPSVRSPPCARCSSSAAGMPVKILSGQWAAGVIPEYSPSWTGRNPCGYNRWYRLRSTSRS